MQVSCEDAQINLFLVADSFKGKGRLFYIYQKKSWVKKNQWHSLILLVLYIVAVVFLCSITRSQTIQILNWQASPFLLGNLPWLYFICSCPYLHPSATIVSCVISFSFFKMLFSIIALTTQYYCNLLYSVSLKMGSQISIAWINVVRILNTEILRHIKILCFIFLF